jgi:hypothetical protein
MAEDNKPKSGGSDEGSIPPVIDLRELDSAGSQSSGTSAQGQAAGKTAQSTPSASAPFAAGTASSSAKKSSATNLEDAALFEQSQAIIAPPEKFPLPAMVKEKFPDLMQLIKETESMNDDERNYWFQILPIMTEEQIGKFRDILINEKTQLKRLDGEYEQEINRLNQKHIMEWKEFEVKEKRKAIQTAEQKANEEEQVTEEELLKRLSQP